jgi:hypothetical protein
MGKQTRRDIVRTIIRWFILGLIILASVMPYVLSIMKSIRVSKIDTQVFVVIGAVALLLGVLWVALWIARRKSLRVWLAYESWNQPQVQPRVQSLGHNESGRFMTAALGGLVCFSIGVYYAFDLSHQLTSEWWQIRDQPELDAAGIAAASSHTLLTVTGFLDGNEPVSPDGYVAYVQDELWVYPCNPLEDEDCLLSTGRGTGLWGEGTQVVPGLTLTVSGGTVSTLPVSRVTFGGSLTERVEAGSFLNTAFTANYNGQILPDGSLRTRGLRDGDLVTVVGRKVITGGVVPSHLIGGDHDQLAAHFRAVTRYQAFLRVSGVIMMIISPVVVVFFWREYG